MSRISSHSTNTSHTVYPSPFPPAVCSPWTTLSPPRTSPVAGAYRRTRMVQQRTLHQNNRADLSDLSVPRQPTLAPQPEATTTEKCDALLQFCERARQLQDNFSGHHSSPRTDFTPYQTILGEIRSTSSESSESDPSKTPEAVALDLMTLTTAYLSSELTHEQSHYWLGVTSALTAATRTTMPALRERLINARSILFVDRSHAPTKVGDLDEESQARATQSQTSV